MTLKDLIRAGSGWLKASVVCAGAAALTAASAAPAAPSDYASRVQYLQQHLVKPGSLKGHYLVKPPNADAQAAARLLGMQAQGLVPPTPGITVPYWSTMITSPLDGLTYHVSMVGSSPYAVTPKTTNVKYVPIIVIMHFPGGFVFDPTKNGNCDSQPVSTRFFNSPLFKPTNFTSNGVNVTPTKKQLISAFQRANFWNAVQGTAYGVNLVSALTTPVVVDYTAHVAGDQVVGVTSPCNPAVVDPLGLISIDEYDALVQSLAATYATAKEIPLVLSYNVVEWGSNPSDCCILGYHNALQTAGQTQLYAVGAYEDPGIFTNISDIATWSHEIAELVDDPFVQSVTGIPGGFANDRTPAWGHIGQVSGCQGNLEDGDPLTGTEYTVNGTGGFVYHYQDLAFHDWFYRTASTSTGGKGSFKGVLAGGGQAACH
jgi:hypothetical protein